MNSALFLGFITSFPWFSYGFSASTPSSLLPMMEEKSWVSSPWSSPGRPWENVQKNRCKNVGKNMGHIFIWKTSRNPETYIGTSWEHHEKPWETTTIDGGFIWEHHLWWDSWEYDLMVWWFDHGILLVEFLGPRGCWDSHSHTTPMLLPL